MAISYIYDQDEQLESYQRLQNALKSMYIKGRAFALPFYND